MKVLYLVPQSKRPDRLAAYTFLDEEIHAVAARGVQAFVLSRVVDADCTNGRVRVVSTGARVSVGERVRAAGRLLNRTNGLPLRSVRHPLRCYRCAWTEHVAAAVVKEEGIDLIHSHFAWPQGMGGAFTRTLTGRPLVASLRGTDILEDPLIGYGRRRNAFFAGNVERLLHDADRTVYFSDYMRQRGLALGARDDRTRVIRKGVDLSHFTPSSDPLGLRSELGLPARPMILTVGGLIPRKGIGHLIEAAARIAPDVDFTVVVCGSGPERANLLALAGRLGLADRVVFTGRVDRMTIPKYFAACDVFVLASIIEAAGNVLFEAMSCAKPVVCTDAGGPSEYVVDGATGFVVPVGDTRALAARLRQLLGDAALCERLGDEARRRATSDFGYDRMVSDLLSVYDEVITRGPAARLTLP